VNVYERSCRVWCEFRCSNPRTLYSARHHFKRGLLHLIDGEGIAPACQGREQLFYHMQNEIWRKGGRPMKYIDMLSKLGAGSAHPGGFRATLRQLRKYPLPPNSRVLEVGCGTGRTACYLAAWGYRVTAVDLHRGMLDKAERRAAGMGVQIEFVHADACALPFPDESFDTVMAESVTNFTEASIALTQYRRVLKSSGVLFDRELMLHKPLPEANLKELREFFGMAQLLLPEQWERLLAAGSFQQAEIVDYQPFTEHNAYAQMLDEDPLAFKDEDVFSDSVIWQTALLHNQMIFHYADSLSFGIIRAVKS